jgi:hypothetical protein
MRSGRRIRAMPKLRGLHSVLFLVTGLVGCGGSGEGGSDQEVWEGDVEAAARLLRPHEGTHEDWQILRDKATWAWELGLDTLPMGESMAFLGVSFVGTEYVPNTLELPGNEDVVINLEGLDCVTFVENVLALAHFIRRADPGVLDSEMGTKALYRSLLETIRYRGGRVDGYLSRLHYFSDWIQDNEAKGLIREVTAELYGEVDIRAIDFMSQHPESYRQLASAPVLEAIRQREEYLSGLLRYRIPEEEIASRSSWIQDGDIIGATSTVDGLDVAHTGLAFWKDGQLHLLHAPLVGESVEVSSLPLADRILRIPGQDGLRVVRPLPPDVPGEG